MNSVCLTRPTGWADCVIEGLPSLIGSSVDLIIEGRPSITEVGLQVGAIMGYWGAPLIKGSPLERWQWLLRAAPH